MDSKTPLILLLILSNSFLCSSLSTFSISETSNQTLICSLIPSLNPSQQPPFLNCTNFPIGSEEIQIPTISPNITISGITSGIGFLCIHRSPVLSIPSSISTLNCWRFSSSSSSYGYGTRTLPQKRIYKGPVLDELEAGDSHICARVNSTNRIECWQWPGVTRVPYNISRISVGEDFVCGITEFQTIKCFGTDTSIVGREPTGNYSVVSAGNRHSCAISTNGKLNCWGNLAGKVPVGKFESLASGNNRSCGIRNNGTVVCWGENDFELPKNLQETQFLQIEAKKQVFCGVDARNFSLLCWGNENFNENPMVFRRIQPGPCRANCPCKILPGSVDFCSQGNICMPCHRLNPPAVSPALPPVPVPPSSDPPELSPPLDPPKSPPSSTGDDKKRVPFLVIGSVGTFSLALVSCFLLFKFCKGKACRIHDSGPLAQGTVEAARIGSNRDQILQIRPQPEPEPEQEPVVADNRRLSQMVSMGSNLEEFSWEVLVQATDSFSNEHKIGQGSFGTVYQGILDDGREVAIKRADFATNKHQQEKENAFLSELSHLSRLNHKNLVRLFGYCDERSERLLVYEFMINGTLNDHLHKLDNSPIDTWISRFQIAVNAARGIEYLHTYAVPSIIHRDIKSSNILLDATFTAKVSDFGLSLLGPKENESHLSLRAAGTLGYMDPEYYRCQKLTSKSDVYSFGVMLLELLSGYKAIHPNEHGTPRNVVDYAMPFILNDNIHRLLDAKVPPPTPFEIEAVTYVGYLAADCVNLEGKNRPSMAEVVTSLEKALAACEMPLILSRSTTRSSA